MSLLRLLPLFLVLPLARGAEPAVRAVWIRQLSGEPDPHGKGTRFCLMARELPQPERRLLAGPGNFSRPLLSPDGATVFYTDRHATAGENGTAYDPQIFAVPFAGGEPRKLGEGMAVAVWRSPEGNEFVYALTSLQTSRRPGLTGEILVRFEPAKPDDREIMWTESPLGADNFQLSRDGTRAAGLFPWPQAGLADMDARTFTPLAQGSFPSLAPDDSYALSLLDGDRRRLRLFVPGVEPGWELQPAQSLPQPAGQINYPRWTNDPLHLVFAGPPAGEGNTSSPDVNTVKAGDAGTPEDVYLAALRPDLRSIEKVTPLSADPAPDYFPDAWIQGARERVTTLTQHPAGAEKPEAAAKWPLPQDALHFAWENAGSADEIFTMHGFAVPGLAGSLNVSAGWAEAAPEAVAKLTTACAASGSLTMEALITERSTMPPCSVRILSLRTADERDAFALYRVDRSLVLRILTGGAGGRPAVTERHVLSAMGIEPDRPFLTFLTLHAGRLQFYLDGQMMKEIVLDQSGLQAWKGLRLVAGDSQPYGNPWTGQVERIACWSRALAAAEITDEWTATQTLLTNRLRPTRYKVKARLVEMPAFPDNSAAPRSLHASAWEIEQVFTGSLKEKKVVLLQWAWLDGKRAPLPDIKPGQSIELPLESLDDHPELRGVPAQNALTAGELPVFVDVTVPGRHPAPFPQ